MGNMIWSLLLVATMTSSTGVYRTWNWRNGIIHRLDVVQDVAPAMRGNLN